MTALSEATLRTALPKIIPPLTGTLTESRPETQLGRLGEAYKGDMGRVGVVGGCREYSGAPYFAAISALRLGADLSHVFTTRDAATVIKSYSPELIVHQSLYESDSTVERTPQAKGRLGVDEVTAWFNRLDALVIGPGLGQDPLNSRCAKLILESGRDYGLPLILDADALYLVTKDRELVQGYSSAVLTPNVNELRRLATMLNIPTAALTADANDVREEIAYNVARCLDGPILISKGSFDVVTNGVVSVRCTEPSTPRRCGGQGDVLSGCAAVLASWAKRTSDVVAQSLRGVPPLLLAAYGACVLTRRAAHLTFSLKRRSMVTSDVIEHLVDSLDSCFDL